jgi:hypothetical protein
MMKLTTPLLAVLLLATTTAAQEPKIPEQLRSRPDEDMVDELKRLFQEVERNLELIDYQLADAGAGEIPLSDVGDSGLEKLLRDSQDKSEQVLAGIDKILEIAAQMGQSMGSGMGQSEEPKPGDSPLDQERDKGPQDREETPEEPGQQPDPEGQDQEQPQDDGDPKSPKADQDEGENRPGDPRQDPGGPPTPPGDDVDKWGVLPDRVREKFRNQGADELPVRYRDWIDSYYRRLNKRGGR